MSEAGQPEGAIELLLEMLGGPGLPHYFAGTRPLWHGLLTRAEVQQGHSEAARQWATRADDSAEQVVSTIARAHADLALAEASLADEATVACELAARSAEAFEQTGALLDGARARLIAGRASAAGEDRDGAGEKLRRAEESFAWFGAQRLRAEAVRELRRIGRRVSRTGRRGNTDGAGLASLSGREREVAELVTARKTNRECR